MFGRPQFRELNAPLAEAFGRHRPLVAVHRGTGLGSIAENSTAAVTAALAQGADMVEIDVVESTDGDFFLFHDGYEPRHLGIEENIRSLDGDAIRALSYRWNSSHRPYPVTPLDEVLRAHPTTLFNVDRSWWWWPRLLPWLDRVDHPGRLVLKCPVEDQWLDVLEAHPVTYPLAPMVRSHAEVLAVLDRPGINTVGMELLPDGPDHELAQPGYVRWLQDQRLFVLLNAINLADGVGLFLGWDDETSVLRDPDAGWGRLVAHGADIIQTDWPGLLVPYLQQQGLRPGPVQRPSMSG